MNFHATLQCSNIAIWGQEGVVWQPNAIVVYYEWTFTFIFCKLKAWKHKSCASDTADVSIQKDNFQNST